MAKGTISSGDRTELVEFQRLMLTPDGQGGHTEAWNTIGRAWADVQWVSGGERKDTGKGGAVRAVSRYRARILSAALTELALVATDRMLWNNDVLQIVEPPRVLDGDGLVIVEFLGGVA